ncbi:hypothetical protein CKW39_09015 [Kocuria sp. WRN011]|uniref:hypothetical protein n=1 Tax=Kocuria sp. WRN011 TaxID=2029858 RepID=UPI000BB03C96|nr:hypothetical protein [Kocuria sp. WRN011]PBB08490.1 hypothetical protein CKW39_09015 [Kocuria sp. WRN011]
MATTDYSKLTDAQLEQTRVALMSELERRRNLARIPTDIRALAEQYEAAGGDPAELAVELGGQ